MSEPDVRPLDVDAVEPVARLEAELLHPPWSAASIEACLRSRRDPGLTPGAWLDGTLAGYALAAWMGDRVELHRLAVRPANRRRGLARALVERVAAAAVRIGAAGVDLELRADNDAARAFYADFGFREVGRRPGYYRSAGESLEAVLMSLEVGDSPREPDATSR